MGGGGSLLVAIVEHCETRQAAAINLSSLTGFSLLFPPKTGSTGFYWLLLGFTGFYWVLLGFTGFY